MVSGNPRIVTTLTGCSNALKQRLKDVYVQKWLRLLDVSSISNFRLFKTNFERSKFLKILPENMAKSFLKFRTRNHKLPIETGRWAGIAGPYTNFEKGGANLRVFTKGVGILRKF